MVRRIFALAVLLLVFLGVALSGKAQPPGPGMGPAYTNRVLLTGWRYLQPTDLNSFPGQHAVVYIDIGIVGGFSGLPLGNTFCVIGLIDAKGTGFPAGIIPIAPPYPQLVAGTININQAITIQQTTAGGQGVFLAYMVQQ